MDFEGIYRRYFKDVYHFTCGLAGDADVAEEVTQETFAKALRTIDSFDGSKDIRAWLFTIARNTFYSYCRKNGLMTGTEPPDMPDTRAPDVVISLTNSDDALHIHRFLHQMREPYKEVFNLRVFGELSFEQIARIFGKSPGWARVTYYRAKQMIVEYLESGGQQ
ncbi:RNA polymerase sigma factor [Slackia heliotrinireducens]|uniref:RNA polymerase sigma factor n=1 Tax=Slackia heliotrinireducens (strain ATCC 29202 / DSM 20476 / NCTC 11029 / RHS 1) TaxID=471855 RepID=C7N5I6_SLAHD|nr:RNA polymerase sigma factor [Slackia heliotrinireducens]ACV22171.1 RNA polymerase sigma factor, sigma-70 family [Slackia heliotrinireducens DSM 20476]VEH00244.1 RNA polymerase sigma factor sigM [Slackia heliotrinireducens]